MQHKTRTRARWRMGHQQIEITIRKDSDQYATLSDHFNGHFPNGSGLAGTRTSPFGILLELRMMEVVVVTTVAIKRASSSNRHHQHTNTQFFTGQMPFLSPNQQCQSAEGKLSILNKFTYDVVWTTQRAKLT